MWSSDGAPFAHPVSCRVCYKALKIYTPLSMRGNPSDANGSEKSTENNCNSPMSSHAHGSPGWSAEKKFALLMLLTGSNRKAAQRLWLRKVRIHREAPPDAGGSAPKAATAKPQPAPARAQAVPRLETAAQLARR